MQIKDYPLITALSNDDLLLVQTASDDAFKSLKVSDLKSYIGVSSSSGSGSGSVTSYPSGMALLLDGGSLIDKSGNSRNASPIGDNSPLPATGIDGKKVLRWNGSGNQELQVTDFLDGTTGATLYCVYSVTGTGNYNLVRTYALDDYWHFIDGNGYIGTFQNVRHEAYPPSMPNSGNHLISIHASSTSYEVVLDTISKGSQSSSYASGDRFRIGTNDKSFSGDIALLLVYPQYVQPNSTSDLGVRNSIKSAYPSLSI
ncbi:MAG: hypothetical protein V7K88_28790 [Nostoc sp.]|uniref:hypothetical protein n=1 Tax=Nostoc sp. TaxID=1180 RepID=UPI002FF5E0BD